MGRFPAWFVDGPGNTWVVFVHGRKASREEALRILPTVTELGFPILVISYRNDAGAPPSSDRVYHFGEKEWEEVEDAVRFALDRGAEDVVLYGYSTGAAISAHFLLRSELASRVRGLVFDGPLLDVGAAVDLEAANRGLPQILTSFAKLLSSLRFGIDWDAWELLDEADRLTVPLLLFHGSEDDVVPVEVSDRLAAARPDLVTFVRVPGAAHVRSWNVDPARYEAAVRSFLQDLVG